jgi:hypothetical protein
MEKYNSDVLKNEMVKIVNMSSYKYLKDTLSRIGIANRETKTLTQTVHVLKVNGKQYLTHFKSIFKARGKETTLSEKDLDRFYFIVNMLQEWGIIRIANGTDVTRVEDNKNKITFKEIFVLKREEAKNWTLISKYNFSKPKSE